MAYLRALPSRDCHTVSCNKKATMQLLSRYNGNMGQYCATCGKKALKRVEAEEKAC